MLRPKRRRLDPLENFSFQAIRHDILDEAERGNYAEILLLKTKWELMWRMCGKPPVDSTDGCDEKFLFDKRWYIKKESSKPPAGVLDLTSDEDED
jgi:hypothetical protein